MLQPERVNCPFIATTHISIDEGPGQTGTFHNLKAKRQLQVANGAMEIHVQQDPKVQLRRIQAQPVLVLPVQATSHPRVLRYPLSRGKSPLTPNYYHPESLLLTDAIPRHKPHQTWEKLFRQTTTLRCRGSPELHTLFPYASQVMGPRSAWCLTELSRGIEQPSGRFKT